jgi:hypothetical protein
MLSGASCRSTRPFQRLLMARHRISQGRHPLVEMCVEHYVVNDFSVVGGRGIGVVGDDELSQGDEFLNPDYSVFVATVRFPDRLGLEWLFTWLSRLGC